MNNKNCLSKFVRIKSSSIINKEKGHPHYIKLPQNCVQVYINYYHAIKNGQSVKCWTLDVPNG